MFNNKAFICDTCAKMMGATWPEGHCATCIEHICPYCMQGALLCPLTDWIWPDDEIKKYFRLHKQ